MREQDLQAQLNQEEQDLKQRLLLCDKVKETLDTQGWKEVIEPILNKMIEDVLGGRDENGRWHNGSLDRARKDERKEFLLGYKASLVNLHNAIYECIDDLKACEERLKEILKEKEPRYETPMMVGEYGRD